MADDRTSATPPLAPLSFRVLLLYALPAFGISAMSIVFFVYLMKFYSDTLGVGLAFLGVLLLVARIWDAAIDPLVGMLSDRTSTRWGRRRPWIAIAAIPLAIFFWRLLAPESAPPPKAILVIDAFLFFLFLTCVVIPYEALGAELSKDYDERNRLLGAREAAAVAGMVVGAALPELLVILGWSGSTLDETRERFAVMGMVLGVVAALSCLLAAAGLREPPALSGSKPSELWFPDWRIPFRNAPFRELLITFGLVQVGIGISTALYAYYNDHVLGHAHGGAFLALYLIAGIISIPLWVFIAGRIEKRRAWQFAMGLCAIAFAPAALLGPGDAPIFLVLILISALGLGGILALPPSMQADTIDLDELDSGVRREGQFLGLWSIARKGAQAAGAAACFGVLALAGYSPEAETQPQRTIAFLYAGVPAMCYGISVILISRYDLGRTRHAEISAELARRRSTLPAAP